MKLSDLTPEQWFARLNKRRFIQQALIDGWWQYYDGCQPLYYIAQILAEQDDRFPPLLINWSRMFIDRIDRHMTVEGFRVGGADEQDDQLRDIWNRNDLDYAQSPLNVASLVTGAGYLMVGPDPSDAGKALVTVEEPDSVIVEIDTRYQRPIAGLKVWASDPERATVPDMASLVIPNHDGIGSRLIEFEYSKPVNETQQRWMAAPAKLQTSPEIPIIPFFNRFRPSLRWEFVTGWMGHGRSELVDLKRLVDAANQVATNMMAAVEHHAVPRKWILGAREQDFVDTDGTPLPAWKIATGAIWAVPVDPDNDGAEPKIGQFQQTDLRNFHDTLTNLARLAAGMCDMAPSDFGFGIAENPPSADSIRASREAFTRRCEMTCTSRGSSYERAMRIAGAVEGMDPQKLLQLETDWRDPSTPTQQAKSQVAIANYAAGLSDRYQAQKDYGYSDTTIQAIEAREKANPPLVAPNPADPNAPATGSLEGRPAEMPPSMPQRMVRAPSH